jgi:hypothetical protein
MKTIKEMISDLEFKVLMMMKWTKMTMMIYQK